MTDRFLATSLRRALERDIKKAREIAEEGVTAAIERLGVAEAVAPGHLGDDEKAARRRLRAHARALGDIKNLDGGHTVDHLVEAAAYAQWHRRLFARFLAERNLLRHPQHGVPVTLEEAEELAVEEGYIDGWSAAEAYAAKMLPAVFQPDDPVLALTLAPEHEQALRKLVLGLDVETFQADDALGWTYQFWRALEKERVNKAGGKIGARELPAVTQLFTEPYMVKFLLHNTLGAWCAGKVLAARPDLAVSAADEATLRAAVSPPGYEFDMLRFVREGEDGRWRPAAGSFPGWPRAAAEVRALDPCCGSGHFLTEMLAILSALRAEEEGLSDAEAVAAVLRNNLFGLELDGRCVQIAAFAVALAAWRIGGFQPFSSEQVHIAWVGAPPPLERGQFLELANGDDELRHALAGLHDLFAQAPLLGSLIEPTGGDLMSPQRLGQLEPLLDRLVEKTRAAEPERAEGAVAARGMADAASILSQRFTLVSTNPPFLGQGNYSASLFSLLRDRLPNSKADLCVAFLERSSSLLENGGSSAIVSKQEWCFLPTFLKFRSNLLSKLTLNVLAFLGEEAWEAFGQRGPKATLSITTKSIPDVRANHVMFDLTNVPVREEKIARLFRVDGGIFDQVDQAKNPGARISSSGLSEGEPLAKHATVFNGLVTGDGPRFQRNFWEIIMGGSGPWVFQQSAAEPGKVHSGMSGVVRWDSALKDFVNERLDGNVGAWLRGLDAWGKLGIVVSGMRYLSTTSYEGTAFDNNCSVIVPKSDDVHAAVSAFCASEEFPVAVRRLNPKTSVTDDTFVRVPFDLERWRQEASLRYPTGLPAPYTDDPTQWLFHGHPAQAEIGTQLHVALSRLAGYRWPAESNLDIRLSAEAGEWIAKAADLPGADADGLLPVVAVGPERPLADRLRDYLKVAIPGCDEARLVREADERIEKKAGKDLSLEGWLRDRAFRQHSALFHNRPFLWQVWDGQQDGFSAFLHYHRLDHAALQKLTYTLLGAWIARREAEKDERRVEAAKMLKQKLEAILGGEAPYDIFVRWKALEEQPVGWNPDLDDGVRLNIRPWVEAGVLREPVPKGIKWGVDRGKDVASAPWFPLEKGERNNDRHTTLAEKQAAREAASGKVGAA
ncbi:hypothetical protein [Phenylobacterium sp.]|uniref:Eco57I restriction-modification methylase domain-containing protein n=1 Tax=Phenylobacterium sp. TaxID=1871053 RepID=UPI0025FF3555|nr:hypothetical protein [Phenylobacterium sp.]